jgi:hypothetical protein
MELMSTWVIPMHEDEVVDVFVLVSHKVCEEWSLVLLMAELADWPDFVGRVQEEAIVPQFGDPLELGLNRHASQVSLLDLDTKHGPIPPYGVLSTP